MVLEVPLWTAGPQGALYQHSALLDRRALDAIYSDVGVLRPVTGALQVTQRGAGANMSVDVAAGACVIAGTSAPNQGKYLCRSTATENVIVPSPSVSGTRLDLIIARVKDSEASGLDDGFFIELLEDTQVIPTDSIPLASVSVSSSAVEILNANITDLRPEALQHGQNPRGTIQMWSGTIVTIPNGWQLCDGSNGTPNLRDRFVVGAGNNYELGNIGGANAVTLTTAQTPAHTHGSAGSHLHTFAKSRLLSTKTHNHSTSSSGASFSAGSNTSGFDVISTTAGHNAAGAHTHTSVGGGGSHENRPPYFALAYIMFLG